MTGARGPAGTRPARLLITGSRHWSDRAVMREALRTAWHELTRQGFERVILVHGAARGADSLAASIWGEAGLPVEAHPADWGAHGRAAGPIRNAHMVSLGAELCLAFPLGKSVGTRHCMRAAEQAGIPVRVISAERA